VGIEVTGRQGRRRRKLLDDLKKRRGYSYLKEETLDRTMFTVQKKHYIVHSGKIQGGIEVTGRQRRRRRKLLDDLKERRRYSHLKEEALDRTMWRPRFRRGFGPVVRQTAI
jgi:hypothetical protein